MTQGSPSADHITAEPLATVKKARFERPRATFAFELRVVDGPDIGRTITVDAALGSALVGRSPGCTVCLSDDAIGSRHCSFQVVGSTLRVVDFSEPRATRVNGTLVFEALLVGGETVRIGGTALSINRVEQRRDVSRARSFGRLRGESSVMRELYPLLESATRSLDPVLVVGERGAGKRLLAEELHRSTPREGEPGPFVSTPTGPASSEELSQTLFAPGGLLDQARGGTLYVSDIAALDEEAQHLLARELVKQAQEPASSRVRVIVGARSLIGQGATAQGFMPNLLPSLARHFAGATGLRLSLPPLRAREADVVLLARQFWSELGGEGCLPDDFGMHFDGHAWSGNVRELRVVVQGWIHHGARTCTRSEVVPAALSLPRSPSATDPLSRVIESDLPFARARKEIVAEFERRYVARALHRADHKISRAAAASGIAHRYFQVLKSRCIP
jgi:DNA-binding NtrC family response regulator